MIVQFIRPDRQPEFYSPELSRSGKEFTASNSEQNGDFAKSISVYADGKLIVSGELVDNKFSCNYDAFNLETERLHSFEAVMNASDTFRKSKASNVDECGEIEAPSVYIDGDNLVIVNNSDYATQFDIYVNGVLVLSTADSSVALSDLYDSNTVGLYRFKAVAKNDDVKWFDSFYSDDAKIGIAQNLSVARSYSASGNVGGYAVFAGGRTTTTTADRSYSSLVVDAYGTDLIRTVLADLPYKFYLPCAANVGDYLLVCGNYHYPNTTYVVPYDENLTQLTAVETSPNVEVGIMSGSIGGYAVFAGGKTRGGAYYGTVNAYDTSLTRTNPTNLSKARYGGGSANAGDYLLFAGGYGVVDGAVEEMTCVDAYNEELTLTEATALTVGRGWIAGASAGTNALFAGGGTSTGITSVVTAYDDELTRIDVVTGLSNPYMQVASTELNDCAVFGGGAGNDVATRSYWVYSPDLARVGGGRLTDSAVGKAAASIGDYALFTGGQNGEVFSTVDVICLN